MDAVFVQKWMPKWFQFQTGIKFLYSDVSNYVVAPRENLLRTSHTPGVKYIY